LGFLKRFFKPIKFRFISILFGLCDIDTQRLVKILDAMSFVEFSSYEKKVENSR